MDNKDKKIDSKRTWAQVVSGQTKTTLAGTSTSVATSTMTSRGASTGALAGASAGALAGASAGTSSGTPPLQAWGPFQPPPPRSMKPREWSTRSASSNKSKEASSSVSVPPRYPPRTAYKSIPQRSALPPVWSPPKGRKITKKTE